MNERNKLRNGWLNENKGGIDCESERRSGNHIEMGMIEFKKMND